MFRPPQVSLRSSVPVPSNIEPHWPPANPFVKSSSAVSHTPSQSVVLVVVVVGVEVVGVLLGTVVVVVVVTQAPLAVQPSPTLVGAVSGQLWPPILAHFAAFTTLLMFLPFLLVAQHTSKPLLPQVEFAMKLLTNSFLQGPESLEPSAFRACFTYFMCLLALAQGTACSTASIAAAKPDVSGQLAA